MGQGRYSGVGSRKALVNVIMGRTDAYDRAVV